MGRGLGPYCVPFEVPPRVLQYRGFGCLPMLSESHPVPGYRQVSESNIRIFTLHTVRAGLG